MLNCRGPLFHGVPLYARHNGAIAVGHLSKTRCLPVAVALAATTLMSCGGKSTPAAQLYADPRAGSEASISDESVQPRFASEPSRHYCQIALAQNHGCAIREGQVSCWGTNLAASRIKPAGLKIPWFSPRWIATPIHIDLPAISVAVGTKHSCALVKDGTVTCWGAEEERRMEPLRDKVEISTAQDGTVTFAFPEPAIDLVSAGQSSCVLLRGGQVLCWGQSPSDATTLSSWPHSEPESVPQRGRIEAVTLTEFPPGNVSRCIFSAEESIAECGWSPPLSRVPLGSYVGRAAGAKTICVQSRPDSLRCTADGRRWVTAQTAIGSFRGAGHSTFCGIDNQAKAHCWGMLGSEFVEAAKLSVRRNAVDLAMRPETQIDLAEVCVLDDAGGVDCHLNPGERYRRFRIVSVVFKSWHELSARASAKSREWPALDQVTPRSQSGSANSQDAPPRAERIETAKEPRWETRERGIHITIPGKPFDHSVNWRYTESPVLVRGTKIISLKDTQLLGTKPCEWTMDESLACSIANAPGVFVGFLSGTVKEALAGMSQEIRWLDSAGRAEIHRYEMGACNGGERGLLASVGDNTVLVIKAKYSDTPAGALRSGGLFEDILSQVRSAIVALDPMNK